MSSTKAQLKYDKEHTVQFKLKYNKKSDADIIDFLKSLPNKQGYIRNLIRNDIARIEGTQKTQETL